MADFSSPSSSLQAPRGSASRRESLKSFEKTVRLFEKHPVQAFLVAAGNNSSLFISNRQPSSDQIHEPNDKPSLINHFAGQRIWGLYNHYHSKPLLCVNGTSSDRALTNDVKDFLNSLASHMVENGVGHICGGAETGSMGEGIRAWIKANKEKQKKVEIATVLLKLYGSAAEREKPQPLHELGRQSVKQWSWPTRTPALHGIGLQAAMGTNPGGLGSFFEVAFPMAARQFHSKGIIGIYDEVRKPSQLFFFSSSEYDRHFWAPTADLFKNMATSGACKQEHLGAHMIEPQDASQAIKEIAQCYHQFNRQETPSRELTNEQKVYATNALAAITSAGLEPRDSFKQTSRPFFSFLDNLVASHRVLYHLRKGLSLYSENGLATANEYLEFAVKGAAEERALTLNTLERCAKKPALQLIGSCKDSIWNQDLQRYSVKAIADAVNQDVTVVISGSGTTGMPKKWTEIWVTEMRKFEQLFGRRSQSELVRVQCSYAGKEQDRRVFEGGYSETVVTLLSLDARNEFANSIGAKQAMVLAPGGTAELLAFTQAALNRQLFGKMLTPYENIPTFQVLNTGLKELGNNHYYNPLLEQLRVMERYHTINPNEYNAGWFTQLRNPENDAKSLINDLVR